MKTTRLLFLALIFFSHTAFAADDDIKSYDTVEYTTKILGGVAAQEGDWPWIVALLRSSVPDIYNAQFCSGALIDDTWVLTAAHCVKGKTSAEINVAVGAFDLNSYSGGRISVRNIYMHPGYDANLFQNDIALIELNLPSASPKLPLFAGESRENVLPSLLGTMLTAVGWGMADGTSSWYYPSQLRQLNLPVVDNSYCNNTYSNHLLASQLCAGYSHGRDVCNGDSGGALVALIDNTWVHAGLVSYGAPCADYFGRYGVYTRTSEYIDFIKLYVPRAIIHGEGNPTISFLSILLLKADMDR